MAQAFVSIKERYAAADSDTAIDEFCGKRNQIV